MVDLPRLVGPLDDALLALAFFQRRGDRAIWRGRQLRYLTVQRAGWSGLLSGARRPERGARLAFGHVVEWIAAFLERRRRLGQRVMAHPEHWCARLLHW